MFNNYPEFEFKKVLQKLKGLLPFGGMPGEKKFYSHFSAKLVIFFPTVQLFVQTSFNGPAFFLCHVKRVLSISFFSDSKNCLFKVHFKSSSFYLHRVHPLQTSPNWPKNIVPLCLQFKKFSDILY